MKVTLELTSTQLRVLTDALDAYCRLGLGQLRIAVERIVPSNVDRDTAEAQMRDAEAQFKTAMFPTETYAAGAGPGISSRLVPEDSKIARDLHHTIQHELRRGHDNWSVYSSDEMQFSQQPRATVKLG